MKNLTFKKITLAIFFWIALTGCDPLRLKKCEWYLIPNPEADKVTKEGWVSVCLANQKLKRQKCYYSALPELANRFNGVPFQYSEMEVRKTFPKEITALKQCVPEG